MMDSIDTQTYRDFEHIVIDGGSTDGTLGLLHEYQQKGRITALLSEPDKNLYQALNKGLRLSKGEYIHVMNSDDYLTDKNFFTFSLKIMNEAEVDFTHADKNIVTKEENFITIKKGDERNAFFRMPFRHQTMIVRSSVFDDIGPFDEQYEIASDYKFVLKMIMAGKKGLHIPQVLVCSREGGISSNRQKVIKEVTQVLYEAYGKKYGLSVEDCTDIYLRRISTTLFSKIKSNITDNRIVSSLSYCYLNQLS